MKYYEATQNLLFLHRIWPRGKRLRLHPRQAVYLLALGKIKKWDPNDDISTANKKDSNDDNESTPKPKED